MFVVRNVLLLLNVLVSVRLCWLRNVGVCGNSCFSLNVVVVFIGRMLVVGWFI